MTVRDAVMMRCPGCDRSVLAMPGERAPRCVACVAQYASARAEGFAAGVAEERRRVVAFLRDRAGVGAKYFNQIERGAHEGKSDAPPT